MTHDNPYPEGSAAWSAFELGFSQSTLQERRSHRPWNPVVVWSIGIIAVSFAVLIAILIVKGVGL
jgi:hypothetical protein